MKNEKKINLIFKNKKMVTAQKSIIAKLRKFRINKVKYTFCLKMKMLH